MDFIQTYWSCNNKDILINNFGWISPEYNIMSWTLSSLLLQKQCSKIKLYTDSTAARLFIDELKLPYYEVSCSLDHFNYKNVGLWALAKIHTYSKQNSPFLHIDGDVYIWESFKKSLLQKEIIVQNIETDYLYYNGALENVFKYLKYIPNEIQKEYKSQIKLRSFNAGLFGGTDVDFISKFSKKAFEFVNKNLNYLNNNENNLAFNTIYEQFLLYTLAKKEKKSVGCYIKKHIDDLHYKGFADFLDVPYKKKFLHLHGSYKKDINICRQLSNRLLYEFPEHYYRIISLYKDKKLPLYDNRGNMHSRISKSIKSLGDYNIINTKSQECTYNWRSKYINSNILLLSKYYDKYVINDLLNDILNLEKKLLKFINTTSKILDLNKLNRSDIIKIYEIDLIYSNLKTIQSKKIILNQDIKIVKNTYNWSLLKIDTPNLVIQIKQILDSKSDINMSALIPENFNEKYSLVDLDEFDSTILEDINKPQKIAIVLDNVITKFNNNNSKNTSQLIENLFHEKLKSHLNNKIIQLAY